MASRDPTTPNSAIAKWRQMARWDSLRATSGVRRRSPIAEVFRAGSKFLETIGFFKRLVVGLEEGSSRCSEVRFFCLPCSGWR